MIYEAKSKPFKLQLTCSSEVRFVSPTFDVDNACKDSNNPNIYCPRKIYQLSEQQSKLQENVFPVVINLPPNDLNLMSVNQQTTSHEELSQNVNHLVTNMYCLLNFFTQPTATAVSEWKQKCFDQSLPIQFENYVNLFQFAAFFDNKDVMNAAAIDIILKILVHGETVCLTKMPIDSISDLSYNPTAINACADLSPQDWLSIVCLRTLTHIESGIQNCLMSLRDDLKWNTFNRLEFFVKVSVLEIIHTNYIDMYDTLILKPINSLLLDLIFEHRESNIETLLMYRKELNIDHAAIDNAFSLACKISPLIAQTMIKMLGPELNIFMYDIYKNNLLTLLSAVYHYINDTSIIESYVLSSLLSHPTASSLIDTPNIDEYTPYMIAQEMNHTRLQNLFDQFKQLQQLRGKLLNHTYQTDDHDLSFHKNRIQNKHFFEQFANTYQLQEPKHEHATVQKHHESQLLIHDPLYKEMQRQFNHSFIISNIVAPLEAYTDETPLRIELFDKLKALAHKKYESFDSFLSDNKLRNHDEYHSNAIQLAWKVIKAIKLIRKFNYTTRIDCDIDETNHVLSPYLINIPIQFYHGSYSGGFCMHKNDPNFDTRFRYMYRAIWIHSTKIDLNLLKHPTNFNSWSLELGGAFSVVKFFANQIGMSTVNEFDALGSWPFRYLVILVAEIDWNFVQSVTKWYPNIQAALEEKEVVIPPFCNYEIDSVRMTLHDFKHSQQFDSAEYQQKMLFSMQFLGRSLKSNDIVVYNVTKINCEKWDDWFAKIK